MSEVEFVIVRVPRERDETLEMLPKLGIAFFLAMAALAGAQWLGLIV